MLALPSLALALAWFKEARFQVTVPPGNTNPKYKRGWDFASLTLRVRVTPVGAMPLP